VLSAASGLEWEQRASESGDVGVLSLQDAKLGGVPSAAALRARVLCTTCARSREDAATRAVRFCDLSASEAAELAAGHLRHVPWVPRRQTLASLQAARELRAFVEEAACVMFVQMPQRCPSSGWRARALVCWIVQLRAQSPQAGTGSHAPAMGSSYASAMGPSNASAMGPSYASAMGPSYASAMGPSYASALGSLRGSTSGSQIQKDRENAFATLAKNARTVQWDQCLKKPKASSTVAADEPVAEEPRPPSSSQVERHRITDLSRFENPNPDNCEFPYRRPANLRIAAWVFE